MSLISFTALQDGVTGVNAAATNNPLNTIYNDYNGNITDANIASNAAIAGSKLNFASIANPYKFSVYRNAAQNTGNNAFALLACDTKTFDTGTNVDIVTNKGRFTSPIAGFYYFSWIVSVGTGASDVVAALYKNGSAIQWGGETLLVTAGTAANSSGSGVFQAAANDYFEIFVFANTTAAITVGATKNLFSGFLVSAS